MCIRDRSVIVSRALPDVRDGLKPVHRRIIYAMYKGGYDWSKPFRKSARIVGDVIGKYHPHGDQSVYDALVRLVQDFSMSVPLITSPRLCGGILVAIPTAIPPAPLTKRFGNCDGKTVGSFSVSS